jgi:hypothetical protein
LVQYRGQIVQLRFSDEARVRAHILSVDTDVLKHHVFYDVLDILEEGSSYEAGVQVGQAYACSANDILEVSNPGGAAPPTVRPRPWWKFW